MDEATRQGLQKGFGLTAEEVDSVTPNVLKIIASIPIFRKHRIVAEVTESTHCAAGINTGQRYIFKTIPPVLVPEDSDCPLCIRALGPVTGFVNTIMDRLAEGIDPNEALFNTAECLDPGLGSGGMGKVRFRVYAEKKE